VSEPGRLDSELGRVLVIVPTYNERDNVESIIERIVGSVPDANVLIVDDGSPDGTGKIANELAATDTRIHVLHRTAKAGLGAAYIAGGTYSTNFPLAGAIQATNQEHRHKAKGEKHRNFERDLAAKDRRQPVKNLHRSWDSDKSCAGSKKDLSDRREANREHMVCPDSKAQETNGYSGPGNEGIAKDWFA